MKKYLLHLSILSTLFIGLNSNGIGQNRKLKFGIAAGPSINWLTTKTEGLESENTSISFNYGLYADFRLNGNENYFVSSGIQIQNFNFTLKYPGAVLNSAGMVTESQVENNLTLNYLEFPIGLKLRSDEIGYSHIAGWFGFGTGFRINSAQNTSTNFIDIVGVSISETETLNEATNFTKAAKLSLKIGGEWERKITSETFFVIGVTYENGLTNLLKGDSFEVDTNTGKVDLSKTNTALSKTGEVYKALQRSIVIHLGVYF